MSYTIEKLPKSTIKFDFEVSPQEAEPFLRSAAERLSKESKIPGFRPGKAPYEMIKQRVGEMAILEEALENIIRAKFTEAIVAEDLDTVGAPEVNVEKLAPGNPIKFQITVAQLPDIEKLADYKNAAVEKKPVEVGEEKVEKVLGDLAKMQTKEKIVERAATKADKVIVDLSMEQNHVAVEGGASPNFGVYLGEENYIPGLTDKLVGMKAGEEKEFSLKFPEDHFQKTLAGKDVDIKVKMGGVYELETPEINDEFAKSIGQKDMNALKETMRQNLKAEAEQEQGQRLEQEIFQKLIKETRFADIPEILVNEEINKMIHELEHNAGHQGMKFEDYLKSINKTVADLKLDFAPQAMERVKAALILRKIIETEKIEIPESELDAELDKIAANYKDNDDAKKQIYSPEYREYMENVMKNKKAIAMLKENMVK